MRSPRLLAAAITLLAFAIRLTQLGGDSLWADEIYTLQALHRGVFSAGDHPPLLYLLTWPAIELLGESAMSARLPSLAAGTLAVPLLFALGRALGLGRGALWAALLLALSPFHLRYSQEARHYALLASLALAGWLTLVRALRRPSAGRWAAYGVAAALALYSHYGALVALASQALAAGFWLLRAPGVWGFGSRARGSGAHASPTATAGSLPWRGPLLAAALALALYLPWLPRLRIALAGNVDAELNVATGPPASLETWLRELFLAFAGPGDGPAWALVALSLAGLALLVHRRGGLALLVILAALLVPLPLIVGLGVSRGAMPRYVIYMLPLWLLPAGYALAALVDGLGRWGSVGRLGSGGRLGSLERAGSGGRSGMGTAVGRGIVVLALLGLLALAFAPRLAAEHRYVWNDWQAVLAHLDRAGDAGSVLIGLGLNYPQGYNPVTDSLPYHQAQRDRPYLLLEGNNLQPEDAALLAGGDAPVWALVVSWARPPAPADPALELIPFQTHIYLIRDPRPRGDALAQAIHLYRQIIPLADAPSPQCLLRQDLAALLLAGGKVEEASESLDAAITQCPEPVRFGEERAALEGEILAALIAERAEAGDAAGSRAAAERLRRRDPKRPEALAALTWLDLGTEIAAGRAITASTGAPEPPRPLRVTMPADGDWGDALLLHPPASARFDLLLPPEPIRLVTRLALAPESWGWGGDGATFVVRAEPEDGPPVELLRQPIANTPAEQRWHPIELPLGAYAGRRLRLTLATEPGPAGDGTGDWAVWDAPRLLWSVAEGLSGGGAR